MHRAAPAFTVGMDADGQNGADGKEGTQQIRSTVTEERQSHAFCRQRAADDGNIEHSLEKDDERHPDRQIAAKSVGGFRRNIYGKREKR